MTLNNLLITLSWFFVLTFSLLSCTNNLENLEYVNSEKVTRNIYLQKYQKTKGYYKGTYYVFLTDSSRFQVLVGTHQNEEGINAKTFKNGIYILQWNRHEDGYIKEDFYVIDSLKSSGFRDRPSIN